MTISTGHLCCVSGVWSSQRSTYNGSRFTSCARLPVVAAQEIHLCLLRRGMHSPQSHVPSLPRGSPMTLTRFVTKNAFRNKRRSLLTLLSIGFSLLLLTFMMTVWRTFYIDQGSAESAQRIIVRHKVSLVFSIPSYYREKIRSLPGVKSVVPQRWFGGTYKDPNREKQFAQFGTDPQELFAVYRDYQIPPDQLEAW